MKSGKPQQAFIKLIFNIPTLDQACVPNLNRISSQFLTYICSSVFATTKITSVIYKIQKNFIPNSSYLGLLNQQFYNTISFSSEIIVGFKFSYFGGIFTQVIDYGKFQLPGSDNELVQCTKVFQK